MAKFVITCEEKIENEKSDMEVKLDGEISMVGFVNLAKSVMEVGRHNFGKMFDLMLMSLLNDAESGES